MGQLAGKQKGYTCRDYLNWSDDERWEIIDGTAYNMTPAPKVKHQDIAGNLFVKIKTHPDNTCYTGVVPTDIVFDQHNVVQPDVFIICDKSKISEDNIRGAPDLIIEVASPFTEVKDRREKKNLYERFCVREYIIVFPEREYVERYALKEDKYSAPEIYNWDEVLKLTIFDIGINLWEIFDKEKVGEKEDDHEPHEV